MNKADYKHLDKAIAKAKENKAFYDKLGDDYKADSSFWRGYLNGIELFRLQAKHDYKLK